MGNFRKGSCEVLIATDIAARGIDVDDVEGVYNLDLPYDEEDYVHRIGRTGRSGRQGKAFTFVVGREMNNLKRIAQFTHSKIMPVKMPTAGDVQEKKAGLLFEKIKEIIKAGSLEHFEALAERLLDGDTTSLDVAAALLKMHLDVKKTAAKEHEPKEREFARREFRGGGPGSGGHRGAPRRRRF
jgi:ATP-dependent RNA helicase DeaD